ncbi:uncharacterized protein J4E88_005726 [Alternaria novae-zelandiae]|uniref:uncharacterized protein n=1 Tax=Alternaria novae-zelandiae TaxID=430562 RepID=UPI0020C59116|nr:uncharacterized protein J4E88_005726 [Alternaria novae-zelandiae]KAI4681219.1 hypothetical protein J4E88_005726 [Alternaria novae-zelandiae]
MVSDSKPSCHSSGTNNKAKTFPVHHEALTRLREVLPDKLWPEVRPALSEDVSFGKAELQHGRVLVGHVDPEKSQGQDTAEERALWAHLWKIDCRGGAVLSFYYNTHEELRIGEPKFRKVEFQKWCCMIATDQSPVGSSGGEWEKRLKTVVKIALLGGGYLNPKDYTFPDLATIISVINKRKPTHQACSSSMRNANGKRPSEGDYLDRFIEQIMEPESEDDYLDRDNEDGAPLADSSSPAYAPSAKKSGMKPSHIQELQEAFPPTVWPRVENCSEDIGNIYPGKVYLGFVPSAKSPSGSPKEVWARVKGKASVKGEASAKRSGHILCYWNDGRKANLRDEDLVSKIDFDKPFRYLGDPEARDKKKDIRDPWRASVAICVRAALVHAGMIDGDELSIQTKAPRAAEIIRQNRNRLDTSTARPADVEASDDINAPSSIDVIYSSPSIPIADMRPKKRRMASDHEAGNDARDSVSLATTPAPRGFSTVSSISPSIQFLRRARETGPGSLSYELAASKKRCATLEADAERQKTENEQLQELCKEKTVGAVTLRSELAVAREKIAKLERDGAELQAEMGSLRKLRQAHVKHAQPILLEVMAFDIGDQDGTDPETANRDAKRQYVETYGIEVEGGALGDMA